MLAKTKKKKEVNMIDTTEGIRRELVAEINSNARDKEKLEKEFGKVWDLGELQKEFVIHSFAAPFIIVTRKSDGQKGSMTFQHRPRFYYDFETD